MKGDLEKNVAHVTKPLEALKLVLHKLFSKEEVRGPALCRPSQTKTCFVAL